MPVAEQATLPENQGGVQEFPTRLGAAFPEDWVARPTPASRLRVPRRPRSTDQCQAARSGPDATVLSGAIAEGRDRVWTRQRLPRKAVPTRDGTLRSRDDAGACEVPVGRSSSRVPPGRRGSSPASHCVSERRRGGSGAVLATTPTIRAGLRAHLRSGVRRGDRGGGT